MKTHLNLNVALYEDLHTHIRDFLDPASAFYWAVCSKTNYNYLKKSIKGDEQIFNLLFQLALTIDYHERTQKVIAEFRHECDLERKRYEEKHYISTKAKVILKKGISIIGLGSSMLVPGIKYAIDMLNFSNQMSDVDGQLSESKNCPGHIACYNSYYNCDQTLCDQYFSISPSYDAASSKYTGLLIGSGLLMVGTGFLYYKNSKIDYFFGSDPIGATRFESKDCFLSTEVSDSVRAEFKSSTLGKATIRQVDQCLEVKLIELGKYHSKITTQLMSEMKDRGIIFPDGIKHCLQSCSLFKAALMSAKKLKEMKAKIAATNKAKQQNEVKGAQERKESKRDSSSGVLEIVIESAPLISASLPLSAPATALAAVGEHLVEIADQVNQEEEEGSHGPSI